MSDSKMTSTHTLVHKPEDFLTSALCGLLKLCISVFAAGGHRLHSVKQKPFLHSRRVLQILNIHGLVIKRIKAFFSWKCPLSFTDVSFYICGQWGKCFLSFREIMYPAFFIHTWWQVEVTSRHCFGGLWAQKDCEQLLYCFCGRKSSHLWTQWTKT